MLKLSEGRENRLIVHRIERVRLIGIFMSLVTLTIFLWINKNTVTLKYAFWCGLFVLYLSVLLSEVVGFPSLSEFIRLTRFG